MYEFRHPKYYKELRKRNKLDQAISEEATDGFDTSVRPGPGLKPQAASSMPQATSYKLSSFKRQASSPKPQTSSFKPQATSSLIFKPS